MAMADIDLKDFAVIGLRSEIARLESEPAGLRTKLASLIGGRSTHLRQDPTRACLRTEPQCVRKEDATCRPKDGPGSLKRHANGWNG
jgi:hypothetical protein